MRAEHTADRLVRLAGDQSYHGLSTVVAELLPVDRIARLRAVLIELVDRCARTISTEHRPDAVFTVALTGDDGRPVRIDDLEPPLRALLRAVLATANDDPGSRNVHIGLIMQDSVAATVDVIGHLLHWLTAGTAAGLRSAANPCG